MASLIHRVLERMPASVRRLLKRIPGVRAFRDRLYGFPRGPEPVEGSMRPVVYLPTWLRWNQMPQRPQFILEAFARAGHDVWVIDPTLESPQRVGPRIELVPSMSAVPGRHVILYTHFAPLVSLLDRFEDAAVVYDIMDDLTIYDDDEIGMPEERRVRYHHSEMSRRADLFVVSNRVLGERHSEERPDLIRVENGVDIDKFRPDGPIATQLRAHSEVIGYHGAIAQWFDFEIIIGAAEQSPDRSFVLVGPVDPRVKDQMSELVALPNVEHVPEQPGDLIPSFVRGFSVGLVPFLVNEMTEGVTPLKMYEYMACGVPVVASPLPACVEHSAVATADTPQAVCEEIERALGLGESQRERLIEYGREASWDDRLRPLLDRLDELELLRVPGP